MGCDLYLLDRQREEKEKGIATAHDILIGADNLELTKKMLIEGIKIGFTFSHFHGKEDVIRYIENWSRDAG